VRFRNHQDGLTHEEFVGRDLLHMGPGGVIENRQQDRRPLPGLLGPAAQARHAGGTWAQQDSQEPATDGQTHTFGLGRSRELGLAVVAQAGGVRQLPLELVAACLELVALLAEFEDLLTRTLGVEVIEDGVGLAVEGLAAVAVRAGQPRHVAVAAE
jgi:hypothetical protein